MRIGNLETLEKTGNSENLINLIQSGQHKNLSKSERRKNWWYYYKWYVICGAILLGIVCNITGNALGLWHPSPDFQIAYVGETALPQDTVTALENAFASIGGDFNGDGKVIVKINQYASSSRSSDADTVFYGTASEITLIGDISDCESYFFLMDNPDQLQREQQILACPDGSCPDQTDRSIDDKVILWSDCPVLSELELGSYSINILGQSITGRNQELLSGLYIGRRCFYTDALTDNAEQCSALWDTIAAR
ncbi:MAG: hypothetical protein K2N95_11250 [Lachnospiraceae bacterium]|nr:hypothetical protein [Lachnospiraceae bacterium]